MNTQLKAKLELAIDKVIQDNCEDDYWQYMIHPELVKQMTNAAEMVFDSAQDAQLYYEHESE